MIELSGCGALLHRVDVLLRPDHRSDVELVINVPHLPTNKQRNPFLLRTGGLVIGNESQIIIDDPDIVKLTNYIESEKDTVLLYGEHQSGKSQCAWLAAKRYLNNLGNRELQVAMIDLEGDDIDWSNEQRTDAYIQEKVQNLLTSAKIKEVEKIGVVVLDEINQWGDINQVRRLLQKLEAKVKKNNRKTPIIAIADQKWTEKQVGKQNNPFNIWMQKLGFTNEQIIDYFQRVFSLSGLTFNSNQEFRERLFAWMAGRSKNRIGTAQKVGTDTFGILISKSGDLISLDELKSKVILSESSE